MSSAYMDMFKASGSTFGRPAIAALKRSGLRTLPWGTPLFTLNRSLSPSLVEMYICLSCRKLAIHLRIRPCTPSEVSPYSTDRWLTESNAFLISMNTATAMFPQFISCSTNVTRSKTQSIVHRRRLKPAICSGRVLLASIHHCNLMSIIFSMTLDMQLVRLTGRNESRDSGDLPGFSSGTIFAIFQHDGTCASVHMLLYIPRRTVVPLGPRFFRTLYDTLSGPAAVLTRVSDKAVRSSSREYGLSSWACGNAQASWICFSTELGSAVIL